MPKKKPSPYRRLSKEEIRELSVDLVAGKAWPTTENSSMVTGLLLPMIVKEHGKPKRPTEWMVLDVNNGSARWSSNGVPLVAACRFVHVDDYRAAAKRAKRFAGVKPT